jgi:hypothetical protein
MKQSRQLYVALDCFASLAMTETLQQKRAQLQFHSFHLPVAVLASCGWGQ